MATPTTEEIERHIRAAVRADALDDITPKMVYAAVEAATGRDLTGQRPLMKLILTRVLEEVMAAQAAAAAPPPSSAANGDDDDDDFSEPDDMDDDTQSRKGRRPAPAPKKAVSTPAANAPVKVETDEALARRLQEEEEEAGHRPTRRAAANASKRSKTVESKPFNRKAAGDGSPKSTGPKRAGAGITAVMVLSPALAAFLGQAEMSRPQVVKHLWEYIREKNLQDPADKRRILCDDALAAVFKCKRMDMFQMNKLLSPHVKKREDMV